MASQYAFVTLVTSDAYLQGALTLAAALRDLHPNPPLPPEVGFETVCLVTPETVDVSTIKLLRQAFDTVLGVEVITQEDDKGLRLLGRPDLNTVLTKLHVFRLTQFTKIIFLDADVLPIRPISHLLELPYDFSAVPDVGWPDIFNSGVMVLTPGEDKFSQLTELLKSKGSWDGGDQGLLNEWRGNDWHRLSFIYNTTPTAAYTYAPAYERYGSQISAIHFIGPNKPWNAVPFREPFAQRSQSNSEQVYNYESLVDRWFAVYDKHYRSKVLDPSPSFEVQQYSAAWDQQGIGAELREGSMSRYYKGDALSLDELRKLAVEGMTNAGLSPERKVGEGQYRSMPLEGRFDLIHRPKDEETTPTQADYKTLSTLPTPNPEEIPPSPRMLPVSLPPATPTSEPDFQPPSRQDYTPPPLIVPAQHHVQQSSTSQPVVPIPRPSSPPKLSWNPAVEPPPTTTPSASAFPTDTYFPNVWDKTPSLMHDQPFQKSESKAPDTANTLFQPPLVPAIPEELRKQGHYRQVTGEEQLGVSPSPDRNKIKPIFPWEEKPRHMPSRRFPKADAPQPSLFLSPESRSSSVSSPPTDSTDSKRSSSFSPTRGLPFSLTYANAWDTVPSIQQYATRLMRPPPPQPLAPAFDSEEWRKKTWEERTEASSMDGDDEDSGEDTDEDAQSQKRWTDIDDNESVSTSKSRSRSSSISASYIIKGKKKEYRVRGVQTVSPKMRSQGIQVEILTSSLKQDRRKSNSSTMTRGTDTAPKKQWEPTASSGVLPPVVSDGTPLATSPMTMRIEGLPPATPPGMHSPREFSFPDPPGTARPPSKVPPAASTPPGPTRPPQQTITTDDRKPSNDGSSLASPPSSVGPISPPEGQPLMSPVRKGGRVWDPARGVEVFKRGSEEVLARFLRMGSWEEELQRT